MSNEELALEIQGGATERMGELWEQVKRFIVMKARHVMTALEGRADVELDDLIQSGYLALVDAVADYNAEQGAFLTVFGYRLKNAFAEATRFRSLRQQRETLTGAFSLDAPITDEANASVLGDFQEDPAGVAALEKAEDRIYQTQLKEAIEIAMATVPERYRDILHLRYWGNLSLRDIGDLRGISWERVRQMENKGIRILRHSQNAYYLRSFYDFDFYSGAGLSAFRHSGMSVQERYLMIKEDQKERELRRHQKSHEDNIQTSVNAMMESVAQEAEARVASMSPEEKARLLAKYGYA